MSDNYDLSKNAFVLVFHHDEFTKETLTPRLGSAKDMGKIETVLNRFKVDALKVHNNYSLDDIRRVMDGVSCQDFSNNSCLIVFIMSHGFTKDHIYASDGQFYALNNEIVEKCTSNASLKRKPKIFIVQACLGSDYMQSDAVPQMTNKFDIALLQSTYPGSVSFRKVKEGTYFLQALLSLIETCDSNQTIDEINMRLNHSFAELGINQTPTYTTTLRKRFLFGMLRKLA